MHTAPVRIDRKRYLITCLILLVLMIWVQEYSGLDMRIQQLFYRDQSWMLDYSEPVLRILIYQLPRALFIVLCLLLVPAIISAGKQETYAHCPHQYQEFGGPIPYVTLMEVNKTPHDGRCFPAGHASGGFALMLFVMIASTGRQQMVALVGAMTLGWARGVTRC